MFRYALRVALLASPFLIAFGIPALFLGRAGEFVRPEALPNMFAENPGHLYGPAYSNPVERFKNVLIADRPAEVLVLGTSRVLQVRQEAFPGHQMINAGKLVTLLNDFRIALDRIPASHQPKVLVLGLDQYFFNVHFDRLAPSGLPRLLTETSGADVLVFNRWRTVWSDIFSGKLPWRLPIEPAGVAEGWGAHAVLNGNGYRRDGSYRSGKAIDDVRQGIAASSRFGESFARIQDGGHRFEPGTTVHEAALVEVERLLDACESRGITVVAFTPPYAHTVWQAMVGVGSDQRYAYLRHLAARLGPIFASRGSAFIDASDLASLGASDEEALDGFHASEKAYLRLLIRLVDASPELARFTNRAYLIECLSKAPNGIEVWP